VKRYIEKTQFLPKDLEALFESDLHLGTFVVRHIDENGEILAYVALFNSGEIRVSSIRDSDIRSDDAATIYNPWFQGSLLGAHAFKELLKHVVARLAVDEFQFVFFFFPGEYEINRVLASLAKIDVSWKARIWYVNNQNRIDLNYSSAIFYDPRQCLM